MPGKRRPAQADKNRAARDPKTRHCAWRHGRTAETVATVFLRLCGWRILARNWRSAAGEIDIIARRAQVVAFIEVKTRDEPGAAGEAIGPRQRDRIRRAASLYLARHPGLASLDARFDAVLIMPWRRPIHLRDAWRE